MTDHNEALGIRSIKSMQKKRFGEVVGMYLKEAWYFEKGYEKLILVGLCVLGLWKLIGFF